MMVAESNAFVVFVKRGVVALLRHLHKWIRELTSQLADLLHQFLVLVRHDEVTISQLLGKRVGGKRQIGDVANRTRMKDVAMAKVELSWLQCDG